MKRSLSFILLLVLLALPMPVAAQEDTPDCSQFHPEAQRNGDFCVFPELEELNFINHIEIDEAGRIWVGTDGRGLNLVENGTVQNWQPENSEIREDAIRGLAVRDGIVATGLFGCGGCGGVSIYNVEADSWTNLFPEDSELSGGGVGGINIDANQRLYMPAAGHALDIWDGSEWQHISPPSEGSEGPFQIIGGDSADSVFDSDGVLWVGYYDGLWKWDGTTWAPVADFPPVSVKGLAYDAERNLLWAATTNGLIAGNEADGWTQAPPLPSSDPTETSPNWFEDIAIDAEGRVWVTAYQRLAVFNGEQWQTYEEDILGGEYPAWGNSVAFDQAGNLWLETGLLGTLTVYTGETTLAPAPNLNLEPVQIEELPLMPLSPMESGRNLFLVASGVFVVVGSLMFLGILLYLRRSSVKRPVDE